MAIKLTQSSGSRLKTRQSDVNVRMPAGLFESRRHSFLLRIKRTDRKFGRTLSVYLDLFQVLFYK